MKHSRLGYILLVAAMAAFGVISQAISQEAAPGGDNAAPPAGPRGPRDPAAFRQQMAERLQGALGVSDDEWKVLQPKIEKVQTLSRETRGGMMGMGGGRRGGRPGDAGAADAARPAPTDVEKKAADLQKVVQNKDSKPEELKAALAGYRDARSKARTELEAAQKDLKEVLTLRQEAVLVTFGLLD